MQPWLKLGYLTDPAENLTPNRWRGRSWVSDSPGRNSPRWDRRARPRRGQPYPSYGPRYEIGDRLVMYLTGAGKCPAILEVTGEPHWDPARVDREGRPGKKEGDRWAVVTEVRGLYAVSLADAPHLEDIGISGSSIGQKGHLALDESQYAEAERLIAGAPRRPPPKRARQTRIPIEAGEVEAYDVTTAADVRRAVRRESKLVRDYAAYVRAAGDAVSRNKLIPAGGRHPIYTDLFNETRNQLVEAKAGTSRNEVRMAIGQLADYGRFLETTVARGVLFDAKPHPDLIALLDSQEIATIWRKGEGFGDSVNGSFT